MSSTICPECGRYRRQDGECLHCEQRLKITSAPQASFGAADEKAVRLDQMNVFTLQLIEMFAKDNPKAQAGGKQAKIYRGTLEPENNGPIISGEFVRVADLCDRLGFPAWEADQFARFIPAAIEALQILVAHEANINGMARVGVHQARAALKLLEYKL